MFASTARYLYETCIVSPNLKKIEKAEFQESKSDTGTAEKDNTHILHKLPSFDNSM